MKNLENILDRKLRQNPTKAYRDTEVQYDPDGEYEFVNPLYKGDLQLAEYIEERIKNRALRPSSAAAKKIKLSRIDYGSLYDSTDFKYTRNRYDRSY